MTTETDFKPGDEIFLTDLAVRHLTPEGTPEGIVFEALEATNMTIRDIFIELDAHTARLDPALAEERAPEIIKSLLFERYERALLGALAARGRLL